MASSLCRDPCSHFTSHHRCGPPIGSPLGPGRLIRHSGWPLAVVVGLELLGLLCSVMKIERKLSLFASLCPPRPQTGPRSVQELLVQILDYLVLVMITPSLVSVPQADNVPSTATSDSQHPHVIHNTAHTVGTVHCISSCIHVCKSSLALCSCCRRKPYCYPLRLLFSSCTPSVAAKILRPFTSVLDQHAFCVQKSSSYSIVFSIIPSPDGDDTV